jgi:uncharacterized protein
MTRIFLLLFFLNTLFNGESTAQNKFIPWNSDVSVGDQNIITKNAIIGGNVKPFGGPQSGAFFLIRLFQIVISPQDGPNCRFIPTCSRYGQIAVLKYGALAGSFLAGDRLLRCNPYNEPGEDPVPTNIFK